MSTAVAGRPRVATAMMRWTSPGGFAAEIRRHRDRVAVSLSGELDIESAPLLNELLATVTVGPALRVTVDLSQLDFIGAAGLTSLLRARWTAESQGGQLTIRAPSPRVRSVLELVNLTWLVSEGALRPRAGHSASSQPA